ncbi:hypothetical protein C3492_09755 [Streptomyces sp. Ru62]|nr:hypothetical protein C3492_09755 [Streptomyces sp. Ru62]
MGFSGHLVFARSTRPLLEAPVFDSINPELKDTVRCEACRAMTTSHVRCGPWTNGSARSQPRGSGLPPQRHSPGGIT